MSGAVANQKQGALGWTCYTLALVTFVCLNTGHIGPENTLHKSNLQQ